MPQFERRIAQRRAFDRRVNTTPSRSIEEGRMSPDEKIRMLECRITELETSLTRLWNLQREIEDRRSELKESLVELRAEGKPRSRRVRLSDATE